MNPVQRILAKILDAQTSHPLLALSIAVTLAVLSILYTVTNLGFHTSQKQLISPQHRLIQLSEQIDQFEDLDTFVVAIENQDIQRSLNFLKALVSQLQKDPEQYLHIFFRVDPKPFRPWALLYLEKKDLLALHDRLQEHQAFIRNFAQSPTLINFFRQINEEMASKMVGELFTGFLETGDEKAPMDLEFLICTLREMEDWLGGDRSFHSPWESLLAQKSWDQAEEGYFWTENKRHLLLLITPAKEGDGFTKTGSSLKALRKAISETRVAFPGIQVGVTGPGALDEDEMGVAFHDMELATLFSLCGLVILLVLFWRGFRQPLMEIITLVVALSLTFGLTTLTIGHLNILSVSFAPMLLGLGIDYGVHWFSRYREERETRGNSKRDALRTTMINLGPGVLLAGISAALSFLPLVLTGFKGLVELGIICAMGLFVATIATLFLLPALIMRFEKPGGSSGSPRFNGVIGPLLKLTHRRVLLVLVLSFLGLGLSFWGAGKVKFDLNMLRLQSKKSESVVWEKKLVEGSHRPSMSGVVLARSLEEVQRKTEALKVLSSVSEVQSVKDLLPQDQRDKIGLLRQLKPFISEVRSLDGGTMDPSELIEILGRIRFKMLDSGQSQWGVNKPLEIQMRQVRDLVDHLQQHLRATERTQLLKELHTFEKAFLQDLKDKFDILWTNIHSRPMRLEDLPRPVLDRFVGKDNLYLIRVFPALNIWEPELLGQFVQDLRTVDPDAIGDPVTLYVFTQAFRDACIKAAIYAAAFISILLLFTFRSPLSALLAMVPLVVGTAWTFGLIHFFGVNLNLANSIFLPLVVGAGVEYGIIIVQRWRHRGDGSERIALPFSTGLGVILAGLTTTVGFSSLILSDHQGLYSLGLLTGIGSLAILAAAVLFLPALLHLLTNWTRMK